MLFMGKLRTRAKFSFLLPGDKVVYYLLSMCVTVSLVSILGFPFDGGLLGPVLLL